MAMLLPEGDSASTSEELSALRAPVRELPFLNVHRFLARHRIAVPEIYGACMDAGVLLLEDLGDRALATVALETEPANEKLASTTTAGRAICTNGASRARRARLLANAVGDAVETLAAIAALIEQPDERCIAFQQTYDRALIGRELEVASAYGLASSDAGPPRDPGRDPEIAAAFDRLGDELAAQPLVLMHRDYHAWNLHVDEDERIRVIDFQDAMRGPALHDLASLFTDRDSDRFVDPDLEGELVTRYGEALARRGGPAYADPGVLRRAYFSAVAYRTLRVIGRFRYLAIEKEKRSYLRFLPRMGRQTRRALEALDDSRLLSLLATRAEIFA
jgi:aminoglycoside/choline kinase family phosphotransferase